ncbi:SUKH-3 domain-containing protein [Paraflavitalea speifideaquila]|uniref:SUKH-3 domain-containing protein n=1 Tax=Paraflavitalea speifideaquila TaxID=3076558 RepID=UPI0028E94893|nr:SUKH-3 domain-containing protein [Paraflavitalea speifideiaquila]
MDDTILSILDSAGWYENRSINIAYEIDDLKLEGFTLPNENLILLWKEFWNLRIEFTLPTGEFSDIELSIEKGRRSLDTDDVKAYERIVSKTLIPAGLLHFGNALLLISLDLCFYMVMEEGVYQVGESFEDFLDVTINRKPLLKFHWQ